MNSHSISLLVFFFTLSKMSYRLGMRGLTIFFSFLFWEWEETVRTGVEREKGSSRQTKKNNTLRSRWESMTCCCGLEETKFLFGVCCNCQASCPIAREEAPLSLSLPRVKEKKKAIAAWMISNCPVGRKCPKEGNGRLIETIKRCFSWLGFYNNDLGACPKQEATLDFHPSSVPRDVSHVVIQSCRSVIFHHGGLKHLSHLSIVTVVDVGEVVFHPGSFNQHEVRHPSIALFLLN